MADATVAADFNQTLDVQADFATQVTFDLHVVLDVVTELGNFVLGKILHAGIGIDLGRGKDFLGNRRTDAEDLGQADFHTLFSGQVNARNTCHVWYTSM